MKKDNGSYVSLVVFMSLVIALGLYLVLTPSLAQGSPDRGIMGALGAPGWVLGVAIIIGAVIFLIWGSVRRFRK